MLGLVVYVLVLLGFVKIVELVFTFLDKLKDNK
jgi:hypothetical protein